MQNHSDQQLLAKYLKGDEKSLEILIRRYLKPIYNFIYQYLGNRQEAEDVTQDVFVKTWRNLKKFKKQKSFKTWIFTIAKNSSIDWLKKKKTIPFSGFSARGGSALGGENDFAETLIDPSPLPDELFERADVAEILDAAMNQLGPKYRMVVAFRYNDGFTFQEISQVLREPLNTIKSRYRRALIALRKLLSKF